MMMHSTEIQKEKVVLIAIRKDESPVDTDLDELSLLAETAGAVEVGRVIQKREAPHAGHYMGKGKIDEVKDLVDETGADAIIADDELSPAQQRNLAKRLGVKILDRTMVILDIFAQRAQTSEGKAQVELAQLKYRLSHLTGLGIALSRQAGTAAHGGVGNRGPGEKKLELDRRYIRSRIDQLNKELADIRDNRAVLRKKRIKQRMPVMALVGYTNAGKSTLMNTLTGAGVLAEDKLFATLDTTTRKTTLPEQGAEVLFTDTVGFIGKLPHHLIKAFRATLEELLYADILLHVVDVSAVNYLEQMQTVYETLKGLGCMDKPIITVLNKIDIVDFTPPIDPKAQSTVFISAKTGENISNLLTSVEDVLNQMNKKITVLIPYTQGGLLNHIYGSCKVISTENREDGTFMEIYATPEKVVKLEPFRCASA